MCMLVKSWDIASPGAVVNCFRKTGVSNKIQAVSVEDMDDPFKLLAEDLEELKLRGVAEENVDMDDYIDINYGVSVIEIFCLTDIEILATVCIVEEQDDPEYEELN